MSKHRTYLLVGAVVSGVLVLATAVITASGIGKATVLRDDMLTSFSKLQGFFKKNPYPNAENVAVEKQNFEVLKERYSTLHVELSKSAVIVEGSHTPGSFSMKCEETVNALRKAAPQGEGDASVVVPNFNFGFERYDISQNGLPADQKDVPRLLRQLRMVDTLVRVFYSTGIIKLDKVMREEFDSSVANDTGSSRGRGRVSRRGAVTSSPTEVVIDSLETEPMSDVPFALDRQRFGFVFLAKETSLFAIMDKINAMWPFAQISKIEFVKSGSDVVFPSTAVEAPASVVGVAGISKPPAGITSRIVSGALREAPVNVAMTIDIYTFGADKAEDFE